MMINMINFTWFIRPSRMILDHDGRVWKINGLRPDERASVLQFLTLVMRTRVSTLHDPDLSHAIQTISNGTIKKTNDLHFLLYTHYYIAHHGRSTNCLDALIACGVDDVKLFMDETQAQRIADDIFDNLLTTCMDMTFKELDDHFKTYADLTVAQGPSLPWDSQEHKRFRPVDLQ